MGDTVEVPVGKNDAPVEYPVDDVPAPENSVVILDASEVAKEVLAGQWGRGHYRDARLAAKGYDVDEVNKEIFKILGLSK